MRDELSQHLSLREVCAMLGWASTADSAKASDLRVVRRRLRDAERKTQTAILYGDGGKFWTTRAALQRAGLVDDVAALAAMVRRQLQSVERRLDALEKLS